MTWSLDMATVAFFDTVQLRKVILERQQLSHFLPSRVLEPSAAEFIAALAAGNNCRTILQIGCGLSTIALAAAARTTGTRLVSVHTDKAKQEIVWHHLKYLGLIDFVEFIFGDPTNVIQQRADNALHASTNDYIKHVRQQPGADSSTLPLGRGIEVTKITNWDEFKSGRIFYAASTSTDAGTADTIELKSSISQSWVAGTADTIQELPDNIAEASGGSNSESCKCHPTYKLNLKKVGAPMELEGMISSSENGPDLKTRDIHTLYQMQSTTLDYGKESTLDRESQNSLETSSVSSVNERTHARETFDVPCEETEARRLLGGCTSGSVQSQIDLDQSPLLDCHTNDVHAIVKVCGESQCTDLVSTSFKIHFRNHGSQTEVKIQGIDQDMLLTDISLAFNESGVSVQRASISTQDKYVDNVFYVVDGETRTPLHPNQWDAIKGKILQNIFQHKHS